MKFSAFHAFLAVRYERLFLRRFKLENERSVDIYAGENPPPRQRFSIAGAIFPTESTLSRYQY